MASNNPINYKKNLIYEQIVIRRNSKGEPLSAHRLIYETGDKLQIHPVKNDIVSAHNGEILLEFSEIENTTGVDFTADEYIASLEREIEIVKGMKEAMKILSNNSGLAFAF